MKEEILKNLIEVIATKTRYFDQAVTFAKKIEPFIDDNFTLKSEVGGVTPKIAEEKKEKFNKQGDREMIAQAHYTDKEKTIRIFRGRNSFMIAELPLKEANDKEADASLRAMKLQRIEKWQIVSWGREARIRFRQSRR